MAIITRKMSDSAVLPALRASSRNSLRSESAILAKIDDCLKLEDPSSNPDEQVEGAVDEQVEEGWRTVYHTPEAIKAFRLENISGSVLDDHQQLQMERTDMPPLWINDPLHFLAPQPSITCDAALSPSSSPRGSRRGQDDSRPHLCVSDMWHGLLASPFNPFDGVRDDTSCPFFQQPSC